MTVAERININKGDADITMGGTAFSNVIRAPFDPASQLNEGDVLIFPATITSDIFGRRSFNGKDYEFMVIEVQKADGTMTSINWFPSTFTKNVFEWKADDNGLLSRTGNVYPATGTAVDAFLSERGHTDYAEDNKTVIKSDTQKGVEKLLGKKVKITERKLYKTVGFKNKEQDLSKLIDGACLKYDFVA